MVIFNDSCEVSNRKPYYVQIYRVVCKEMVIVVIYARNFYNFYLLDLDVNSDDRDSKNYGKTLK